MDKRSTFVNNMTVALNEQHGTSLTTAQVDNWIGCDTPTNEVQDLMYEVINKTPNAVNPEDIMDLWDECA